MLIEFSVGNYRSFKEVVTFSMVAASLTSKNKHLDANNVTDAISDVKLLKSAAIYGANASGKSNLISAIKFMKEMVLNSSKNTQADEAIDAQPFKLNTETVNQPSYFEIVFLAEGRQYRYGFEVNSKEVVSEWLYHVPTSRESLLFRRDSGEVELRSTFKEGRDLQERTRNNALFLSVVAQFNGVISKKILSWFRNLGIMSNLNELSVMALRSYTLEVFNKDDYRKEIVNLIRRLDIGIDDIQIRKSPYPPAPTAGIPKALHGLFGELSKITEGREREEVFTVHSKFDEYGKFVDLELFNIDENESDGTKKLFSMAGPIIDTLLEGDVLLADELDARLHPLLTRALVGLFNSNETNPYNAQLIFVTHDTNLLSNKFFRRDQIWFTEKDRFGATHVYSLAEYKVRNDASFESDYIRGKYGAIPYVGDLSNLLGDTNE